MKKSSMKVKFTILVYFLIIFLLLELGVHYKKGYKDLNEEDNPFGNFTVGFLPDEMVDGSIEVLEETIEKDKIVLAVKCISESKFYFQCATQEVQIEKVFKGNGIKEGDRLEILSVPAVLMEKRKEIGMPGINKRFVNQMRAGKTYLVFLDRKVQNASIYISSDEGLIMPIFCYDKIENIPCVPLVKGESSVLYKNVSNNEFFIESRKGLEKMEKYKERVLAKYSYSK